MSEQTPQDPKQSTSGQTTRSEDPPVGSKDPVTKRLKPVQADKE